MGDLREGSVPAPQQHLTQEGVSHSRHGGWRRYWLTWWRCTADALESKWGRHTPSSAVVQGAYMAAFNKSAAEQEYNEVGAASPLSRASVP